MPSSNKGLCVAAVILILGGGVAWAQVPKAAPAEPSPMVVDRPAPLEPPYVVGGVTHIPADPLSYDEVGYAGVVEGDSQGTATANGEAFVPDAITAAHKTLPLPSYVEVTALDSGRTILVRVNDRGPMRNDRLIALSPGAAAQMGVGGQDAVPVRVRRVNPPEQERATLRAHGRAAARLETPAALLKVLRAKLGPAQALATTPPRASTVATPPVRPVPAPPPARAGGYVVQVGAFSSQARAEALARRLGTRAEPGGGLWRVRLGPYPTQQDAQAGMRSAAARGFENARIMANDAR